MEYDEELGHESTPKYRFSSKSEDALLEDKLQLGYKLKKEDSLRKGAIP